MAVTESVAGAGSTAAAGAVGADPATRTSIEALPPVLKASLLDEFFRASGAANWGLALSECTQILLEAGATWNIGLDAGEVPTPHQQAAFFRGLCLPDLVLARACAQGHERAWEHFVAIYRQPLIRAAIAITGNETIGRDLADQLYAELYGLNARDGERRCPLASYRGRGSLLGWLRTTLAQRHVDHHRRTRREEPLDELDLPTTDPALQTSPAELSFLEPAIENAVRSQKDEDRFLLAAHFLDGQTLLQIARVLGVHEATVSRKLQRAARDIRRQILRNLQHAGLSRRAAEEALGVDPRDLDINWKKLLQCSQSRAFPEQAAQ